MKPVSRDRQVVLETLELLPEEVYVGLLGEYVDLMTPTTEAPPEFHFGAFAAVLGLVFADVHLDEGTHRYHPTLFVILVGPTGLGRKTTVVRAAVETLEGIVPGVPVVSGEGSRQGMMAALIRAAHPDGMPSTATLQAYKDGRLARAGEGAVGVPTLIKVHEFTKLLRQAGRAATGDLTEFYLELHDHPDRLENNSLKSPMVLLTPVACVLGDSTEEALADLFGEGNVSNGFLNRLSIVRSEYSGEPLPRPPAPDKARLACLFEGVRAARAGVGCGAAMSWSQEGGAEFDALYSATLAPRLRSGLSEVIAREEGHTKRLAMLYALQEGRTVIEPADVQRAWQVALYLSTSALKLAGKVGASTRAKVLEYILRRIEAAGVEGVPAPAGRVGHLMERVSPSYRQLVREFGLARLVQQLRSDGEVLLLTPGQLLTLGVSSETERLVARSTAGEAVKLGSQGIG